jgi:hypothetical protein
MLHIFEEKDATFLFLGLYERFSSYSRSLKPPPPKKKQKHPSLHIFPFL